MRLKFLFIVGIGVGYVLGARAGRARYEQIKAKATDTWEDPRVQRAVTDAQDFVKENAPVVQEKVVAGTKAAVAGVQDGYEKTTSAAKEVSGRVADTAKDVSGKLADTAKGVSTKVTTTAKEETEKVSVTAHDVRDRVTETATEVRGRVAETAHELRERIGDRGEEVVDGVIVAAVKARDRALEDDADDSDGAITAGTKK